MCGNSVLTSLYLRDYIGVAFDKLKSMVYFLCDNDLCIFKTYMDSEIRAIMAQYMPLDNQAEIEVHGTRGNV
ncbi:hypothetical protein E3N88_17776 [Mikania micrantha]|uniref:Uncharacterized protein n=1 Tax=Mikania micrantha TaxID=192012 RepID=A0A5N6NU89_9ASTR|nr:hypothetical protein E3N88_17776 [Mikania micrantha]